MPLDADDPDYSPVLYSAARRYEERPLLLPFFNPADFLKCDVVHRFRRAGAASHRIAFQNKFIAATVSYVEMVNIQPFRGINQLKRDQ
jgi:hypothetical protein